MVIPLVLLGATLLCALAMIPLGLPGTWVMIGAALIYMLTVPQGGVGAVTVGGTAALALVAELVDFAFARRFTHRYGGSRRAAWGAVVGGFVGVAVGFPVPVVGPVIAGLIGTFIGALVAEFEQSGRHTQAARVAYGALIARVFASVTKVAIGVAIAAWIFVAAY